MKSSQALELISVPGTVKAPFKALFIPVSSPKGVGEYMRSLAIAHRLKAHYPGADIRFVLNSSTGYHQDCPFPTYLCPDSPTKHSFLVKQFLTDFSPDLAVFDASGRVAQLKHAKKIGAKTVFICQNNRKVRRGLRARRWIRTDEIWDVQAEFAAPPYSWWAKLKARLLNKKFPEKIGPIFSPPLPQKKHLLLSRYGLTEKRFVVVSAGSGGHVWNGQNVQLIFNDAAKKFAEETGIPVLIVYGPNFSGALVEESHCRFAKGLIGSEFTTLLAASCGALIGAGSALFQCIAFGIPSVSVAISSDQPERIRECEKRKLTIGMPLDSATLAEGLRELVENPPHFDSSLIHNGLDNAERHIAKLLQLDTR